MNWNIGQMNYGWILGLLAIICSVCNTTIHSLPYDEKKGALHGMTGEDRENQNSTLPEREILLQEILRVPRYDVSVIYLKIQNYQILCIVNLVSIYLFFLLEGSFDFSPRDAKRRQETSRELKQPQIKKN